MIIFLVLPKKVLAKGGGGRGINSVWFGAYKIGSVLAVASIGTLYISLGVVMFAF